MKNILWCFIDVIIIYFIIEFTTFHLFTFLTMEVRVFGMLFGLGIFFIIFIKVMKNDRRVL